MTSAKAMRPTTLGRFLWLALAAFAAPALPAQPTPTAELRFFTVDGTATGAPLLPGFLRHSCWSALGTSERGEVYIALSNHQQPGGNVAVYKYDPSQDRMSLLDDIRSVSTAANNWMPGESQYKVHSFLLPDGEGRLWFASDDHPPTPFLRGAHVYTIDTSADTITDRSQSEPWLLRQNLRMARNPGTPTVASGVFVEYYGLKGLYLNPRAPDALYGITYPKGFVLHQDRATGRMLPVGQAKEGAFVFYADNRGNAYYETHDAGRLDIVKYDRAARTTTVVASMPGFEVGAIAPTSDGEVVYWLIADTFEIWRHDCRTDTFSYVATACGTNWWRLYNLSLSRNGEALYYVSNNNARSTIRRIDLLTGVCTEVLDVDALLGSRNLCFGGVNVWDDQGAFYAPVWTFNAPAAEDIGLLRVTIPERPLTASPATLPATAGGTQAFDLRAGPDHGGRLFWLLGSASGTSGGERRNLLTLPLHPNDPYYAHTVTNPNVAPLAGALGQLDPNGRAQATFTLPSGSTALLGLQLHHAFLVLDGGAQVVFTSNAAELTITP